jgi:hypothetical protein
MKEKATYSDLAQRLLPGFSTHAAEFVLWEYTSFPLQKPLVIARELKHFYRRYRAGWATCGRPDCNQPYRPHGRIVLGHDCPHHTRTRPE